MTAVFRFAPSPNGRLHAGHAYSALLNVTLAERLGGRFLLRLEDIDITRCTTQLAEACLMDLRWLGVQWEEPVRIQSQHWQDYRAAATQLRQRGLLYPCFCTRRDIAQNATAYDPDGAPRYRGNCRHVPQEEASQRIAAGEAHAWRLDMQAALTECVLPLTYRAFNADNFLETTVAVQPERWGDVVLVRKEIPTSYHLSVVVDDAIQGVTHVVRGQDLLAATDIHCVLQALLGIPTPRYHHHALLREAQGEKLAKSRKSQSLEDLRAIGVTAAQLRGMLGFSNCRS